MDAPAKESPALTLAGSDGRRVLSALDALRLRLRVYVIIGGVATLLATPFLMAAGQLLLDRWLKLTLDQRALLNALITGVCLWVAYRRVLRPALHRISDERLAQAVDRAYPELRGQLASAVQFARDGGPAESNSPQLVRAVIGEACEAAARHDFRVVLNHRRAWRSLGEIAALAACALAAWAALPDLLDTWFRRNWLAQQVAWPQRTYIQPVGFDALGRKRVPRGEELLITAEIIGDPPRTATLYWRSDAGRRGRERMTLIGGRRAEVSLGPAGDVVRFEITGGDEHTQLFVIEPVDRPDVQRLVTRVTPPAYTGAAAYEQEQVSVLSVPAGSTVEVEAWTNKPISVAKLSAPGGVMLPVERDGSDRLRARLEDPAAGVYEFTLSDFDGLESRRTSPLTLRVTPDAAPRVELSLPGATDVVTPAAMLQAEIHAQDDFGLVSVELDAELEGLPKRSLSPADFAPRVREFRGGVPLSLSALGARPGQRLRLVARATDEDPRGPNRGESAVIELRVVTADEFREHLAQRETELRREFEQLVSAQRALREAVEQAARDVSDPDGAEAAQRAAQRFSALARRQDTHAGRTRWIEQRFRDLFEQMRANQVAGLDQQRRLLGRVADPLSGLAEERMPAASADLQALRDEPSPQGAAQALRQQDDLLREMREVLASILEWEGYREAVALLEQVIAAQEQVRSETLESLASELERLLELIPPDDAPDGGTPRDEVPDAVVPGGPAP